MAQKESSHQEVVDKLETELTQVRRQYDELQVLSRDQVCIEDWLYELHADRVCISDSEHGYRDRGIAE